MNADVDSRAAGRRRIERPLVTGLLAVVFAIGPLSACRVPAPTVQQGLNYGFRTPKQAFESFRTAVQGDLLVEEYRCFSDEWKEANGVPSILVYSEARDEVLSQFPKLPWALSRAEAPEILSAEPARVVLQSRIPGPLWIDDRFLVIAFVPNGYWRAVREDKPLEVGAGRLMSVEDWRKSLNYLKDLDALQATVLEFKERARMSPAAVVELAVGREWKIERMNLFDEPLAGSEE